MGLFLAMALKPFFALALFTLAYLIARSLAKTIPDGKIKTVLFDRQLQARHPWKFFLIGAAGIWGAILLVVLVLGAAK